MKKYTSLFLDLDNTLLDFDMAEKVAVRKVLQSHSLPFDDDAITNYSAINKSYWERFERGEIPKNAIYEGRFKSFVEFYSLTADTAAIATEYMSNLSEGYFKIEGADEILTYLKESGYFLYATTNGMCTTQYKRIKNSGLEPYFNGIFVSEDIGHQKPEKEYFDYIINHIGEKDKSKILVVGDSLSSDILGGINAGIDTCWYNPKGVAAKYQTTFEIKDLQELKNIL